MKKTVLGTIIAVNTVLLLLTLNVLYQEASSPISGIRSKPSARAVAREKAKPDPAPAPEPAAKAPPTPSRTDPAAYLSINSSPSDAKVFISGYHKAQTPASIMVVSVSEVPRQYSVKLLKEGYHPWEKMVTLTRGSTKDFSVNLRKQ